MFVFGAPHHGCGWKQPPLWCYSFPFTKAWEALGSPLVYFSCSPMFQCWAIWARKGAIFYNLAHTYTVPAALAAAQLLNSRDAPSVLWLIWMAHIAFDRMIGYGLKLPSGFKQTHLDAFWYFTLSRLARVHRSCLTTDHFSTSAVGAVVVVRSGRLPSEKQRATRRTGASTA